MANNLALRILALLAPKSSVPSTAAQMLRFSDAELKVLAEHSETLSHTAKTILASRKRHDSPAGF